MPADATRTGYTLNFVEQQPERPALVLCPKCGRNRWTNVGIHGLRLTPRGRVDCMNEVVDAG